MNHLKRYVTLMKIAKSRTIEGIYESHHIFPQSIYGTNSNTVKLTPKEHRIVHRLLWLAFRKRYGVSHWKTSKMAHAYHLMSLRVPSRLIDSRKRANREAITGDLNPAKRKEVREKIRDSKLGVQREDMKGKSYFGASEERKVEIIEKIRISKTGVKVVNYPKGRKSSPCSSERASKISETRKTTMQKFIAMSNSEFEEWIKKQNLYCSDGKRKNSNVTRVLSARGIDFNEYYGS